MPCKYFASNGKPSMLYDSLYKHYIQEHNGDTAMAEKHAVTTWMQTRTENFKKWFGDWEGKQGVDNKVSQIVDENGEPKVLFHGSGQDFTTFKPNDIGLMFFASNKEYAATHADYNAGTINEVKAWAQHYLNQRQQHLFSVDNYDGSHSPTDSTDPQLKESIDKYLSQGYTPKQTALKILEQGVNYDWEREYLSEAEGGDNPEPNWEYEEYKEKLASMSESEKEEFHKQEAIANKQKRKQVKADVFEVYGILANLDPSSNIISELEHGGEYHDNMTNAERKVNKTLFPVFLKITNPQYVPEGISNEDIREGKIKVNPDKDGIIGIDADFYHRVNNVKVFHTKEPVYAIKNSNQVKSIYNHGGWNSHNDSILAMAEYGTGEPVDILDARTSPIGMFKPSADLVSGNTTFDKYISATNDYISRLSRERKLAITDRVLRDELKQRIEKQNEILDQLQHNKSVRILVQIGEDQVADTKQFAMRPSAGIIEMTEGLRLTGAWSDLTKMLDFAEDDKSDMEIAILRDAEKVALDAQKLYSQIWTKTIQHLVDIAEKRNINLRSIIDKDNQFRMKDIDFFSASTISTEFSTNALEQLVSSLTEHAKQQFDEQHFDSMKDLDEAALKFLGTTKPNTHFMLEERDITVMNEKGEEVVKRERGIMTVYDHVFEHEYKTMEDKMNTGQITAKTFYKFENKHFDYQLSIDGQNDFDTYMTEIRNKYTEFNEEIGEDEVNEAEIEKIHKRFDPEVFKAYLDPDNKEVKEPNAGGIFFTRVPKDIKLNPAYERLSQGQKDYHEWFTSTFAKHHIDSVFDYRRGQFDLDKLLLNFAQGMERPGMIKGLGNSFKEWGKNLYSVVAENDRTNTVTRSLTGKQHISPKFKSIVKFLPKDNGEMHPHHILAEFIKSSLAFKNKAAVEEILNLANDLAQVAETRLETNSHNLMKERSGKAAVAKQNNNIANRVEYTILKYMNDTANQKNKTMNKKAPGERGFSLGQVMDSLNSLTRARFMALSPLSATGNLLMGHINNYIFAAAGTAFTSKQLARAMVMMKGATTKFLTDNLTNKKIDISRNQTKLIADIIYRHNMIGDVTEELIYGETAMTKIYALQKGGEFMVQGASMIAQMLNTPVMFKQADGTLKEGTYFDLYSFNDKTGRSSEDLERLADDSPYRDIDNRRMVIQKIKLINQKIHGDYSGALMGKKTNFGRMLFMFKTWVPMAIKERFGKEYLHPVLGVQKGRYKSALDLLIGAVYNKEQGKYFKDTNAKDLFRAFAKLIPGLNGKIKLSDKISDVDRDNINMFVRETQMALAFMTTTMILKSMLKGSGPDDKGDDEAFLTYLTNQSNRLQQELSLYYLPSSYTSVFQNLIPLSTTFTDAQKLLVALSNKVTDPDSDEYKTGYRKGQSKFWTKATRFVPITRSFETTWSAFSQLYNNGSPTSSNSNK